MGSIDYCAYFQRRHWAPLSKCHRENQQQNIRMGFDPFVGVIAKENLINGFLTASAPYFSYYYGIAREWGIKDDGELEYYFDKPHHIDEIDRFAGLLEKFGNRVKLFQ